MDVMRRKQSKLLTVMIITVAAFMGLLLASTTAFGDDQKYDVQIKNAQGSQANDVRIEVDEESGIPYAKFYKGEDLIGSASLSDLEYDGESLSYTVPDSGSIVYEEVDYAKPSYIPKEYGWFEKNGDEYLPSDDEKYDPAKKYYDAVVYSQFDIELPNPSEKGLYEFERDEEEGKYVPSTDIQFDVDKEYYYKGEPYYDYADVHDYSNPAEAYLYEYNEDTREYVSTEDTAPEDGKTYYNYVGYEIVEVDKNSNPHDEGLYEYDEDRQEYVLTEDTTPSTEKTYYMYVGYEEVNTDPVNPSQMGLYEEDPDNPGSYILTQDIEVDSEKAYYQKVPDYEPYEIVDPSAWELYEYNEDTDSYELSDDERPVAGKTYYERKDIGWIVIDIDEPNDGYYAKGINVKTGSTNIKAEDNYVGFMIKGATEIAVDFQQAEYKNITVDGMTAREGNPDVWEGTDAGIDFYGTRNIDDKLKGIAGRTVSLYPNTENKYIVVRDVLVNGKSIASSKDEDNTYSFVITEDSVVKLITEDIKKTAEETKAAAEKAKKAADEAKAAADASKKAADQAAKNPGPAAVAAAQKAVQDAGVAAAKANEYNAAAEKAKKAADEVEKVANQALKDAQRWVNEDPEDEDAQIALENAETAQKTAKAAAEAAAKVAQDAATMKSGAESAVKAAAATMQAVAKNAADAKAKKVKTVTVNVKTVSAAAVNKAVAKAGGSNKYVTKVVLGKKVKKIKKGAFKNYKKVTVLEVKTKKLTKKGVKNSLKGSKVKTVKVKVGSKKANKKIVKKYKKIFTKKNAGKKVAVK